MKQKLNHIGIFYLKLMGFIIGAFSLVIYPAIAETVSHQQEYLYPSASKATKIEKLKNKLLTNSKRQVIARGQLTQSTGNSKLPRSLQKLFEQRQQTTDEVIASEVKLSSTRKLHKKTATPLAGITDEELSQIWDTLPAPSEQDLAANKKVRSRNSFLIATKPSNNISNEELSEIWDTVTPKDENVETKTSTLIGNDLKQLAIDKSTKDKDIADKNITDKNTISEIIAKGLEQPSLIATRPSVPISDEQLSLIWDTIPQPDENTTKKNVSSTSSEKSFLVATKSSNAITDEELSQIWDTIPQPDDNLEIKNSVSLESASLESVSLDDNSKKSVIHKDTTDRNVKEKKSNVLDISNKNTDTDINLNSNTNSNTNSNSDSKKSFLIATKPWNGIGDEQLSKISDTLPQPKNSETKNSTSLENDSEKLALDKNTTNKDITSVSPEKSFLIATQPSTGITDKKLTQIWDTIPQPEDNLEINDSASLTTTSLQKSSLIAVQPQTTTLENQLPKIWDSLPVDKITTDKSPTTDKKSTPVSSTSKPVTKEETTKIAAVSPNQLTGNQSSTILESLDLQKLEEQNLKQQNLKQQTLESPNLEPKDIPNTKIPDISSYGFAPIIAFGPSQGTANSTSNPNVINPNFINPNSATLSTGDNTGNFLVSLRDSQPQDSQLSTNNVSQGFPKSPFLLSDSKLLGSSVVPQSPTYISQFPGVKPTNAKVKILSPNPNTVLDVGATTITVQFPVGNEVEVRVNGKLSDRRLIGRTENDVANKIVTQTWYGVSLQEGENIISVQVIGSSEPPVITKVDVRGAAERLKLDTVESRIPADGRSTATIKGQLLDENGNISNRDAVVTIASTGGEFIGNDYKPDQPGFQVEAKAGQFTAKLKSDLKAKTVRIQAKAAGNLEGFTQLQFETALRPSLVTGVVDLRLGARGTDYYGKLRDFLPLDEDNRTQLDFRSAVFATGAIGEWLFTGALDTQRSLNEDCNCENRLFGTYQSSEQNYPVYGDSSSVNATTPSTDSLYLRLERTPRAKRTPRVLGADPDYFMWGDYNTQEFARQSQQFTAVTRQLHGFKGNYNLGDLQVTAFYGNNVQGFQRDAIAPDGTSGYYFLSKRLVVPGSENIFLELEELNRPGTVLKRQQLNRGPDYEIDYDRGTVLFREPVFRTDVGENGEVLVRRIIVTYQNESEGSDSDIYGGRLQYNFSQTPGKESWFATSYIKENQGTRDFELYGLDTMFSLGDKTKIIAEYARSKNDSDVMGSVSGDAFRAEAQTEITKGVQGQAYYRTADPGFANNATISFVPGQTRYGAAVNGRVTKSTSVRVQYDREENFGVAPQPLDTLEELLSPTRTTTPGNKVDNSLTTISAGVQQRIGKANLNVDWLHRDRKDRLSPDNLSSSSDQLRSRLQVPIAKKLTFVAQNELTLSKESDSVFPDRTVLGLNWEAMPGINLSLTQQFYSSGQFKGNSITSLNVNGEHKFGEDTTLTGRFSLLNGTNELTAQGALGLKQGWTISPGLRLSLGYEHVFGNFFGNNGSGRQFAQPFAVGQSASALGFSSGDTYSVGLDYTDNPNFKANARFEHRTSSSGSNTVISANATGKITPELTGLVRYHQAGSSNQKLQGLGDTTNLKVGLAYRNPKDDKFNALFRYEYRKNPATVPESILSGSGSGSQDHTFALEGIYAPNWQWEFYGKYALRNSTSYIADDFSSSSTTNLGQLRATYRLGYSWDLVGEARLISQSDYTETGFVLETGYYITPNLRLSAGYALGNVDDRDFSGSRSAGGPYVGITMKLNELFDGFGLQKVTPKQQKESEVTPIASKDKNEEKETTQVAANALTKKLKQAKDSGGK